MEMNRTKEFLRYVIPSVVGMAVSASYVITDGIFIGRGIGSVALAGTNIAWPYIALLQATSMMVGVGGGTLASIQFGKGNIKAGNDIFLKSCISLSLLCLILIIIGVAFTKPLCIAMGGSEALLPSASEYLRYYMIFTIFWCGSIFLGVFVRNDGNPSLIFIAMLAGAFSNIIFDYLAIFVFDMGVKGAAIASGAGQIIALSILLTHFIRKKGSLRFYPISFSFKDIVNIVKTGSPELVTQMTYPINILIYNMILIKIMGSVAELSIAVYCVISYVAYIVFCIFLGVSNGIQPLIARSYGAKDKEAIHYYFSRGFAVSGILALILYATIFAIAPWLVALINTEPDLIAMAIPTLRINLISTLFGSMTIICTTYLLATERTRYAVTITICRAIIFNLIFVPLIPVIFVNTAIWWATPCVELCSFIVAMICLKTANIKHPMKLERTISF